VRAYAQDHLERNMREIWPGAYTGTGFDWDVLFDPNPHRTGDHRLAAQYVRAMVSAGSRAFWDFMEVEFPRFRGHLIAGPSGSAARIGVHAVNPAVFA
jgi:hypothetical protein